LDPISLDPDSQDRARLAARRRSSLILIVAFWGFAVLMLSVRAAFVDSLPLSVVGPRRLITALIGALLCFGMARLLALLRNRSFPERVVWGLLGAFLMAFTLTMVTMTLNRVILPVPGWGRFSVDEAAQWTLVWFGYFLAWTGTHLALTYHWESQDHQRRAATLAEMTRAAQRTALRYQLNPHFLFNTLNSIASLVGDARNAEAEAMLVNLAAFIRSTLADEPSGTIPLRQEIDLQRLYLDIERARFGDRLQVAIDLPEPLADAPVPALILQPLIENAILHGFGRSEDALNIRIWAAARDGRCEVSVEDDGQADAGRPGHLDGGLGLRNVAARLHAHYGDLGSLDAGPRAGGGYCARLTMPCAAC
jgi:hypothetical protein